METLSKSPELARTLDCLTESELCTLANIEPSTAKAWRKRGSGPPYIRFGNTFLYPRAALAEHLHGKVKARNAVAARDVL